MGEVTGIEWTNHTMNFWVGCLKISEGCKFCYMYRDQERYGQNPRQVRRTSAALWKNPFRWDKAAKAAGKKAFVFTCSWSDFFIEEADPWRDEAMAIMALTPNLIWQVLTKRPQRMLEYLTAPDLHNRMELAADSIRPGKGHPSFGGKHLLPSLPLPNVIIGVSVENQRYADERIPFLLETPAQYKFLSCEPLIGPIDLGLMSNPPGQRILRW